VPTYHEPLADEIYGRLRGSLSMMEAWLSVGERRTGPGQRPAHLTRFE
jgi:hypothetical protein